MRKKTYENALRVRRLLTCVLMMLSMTAWAQNKTVTGNVTDAQSGEPLIGATITVAGTAGGVVTDYDGNFSITVAPATKQLTVSYVGYVTQQVAIKGNKADVKLEPDSKVISEVVVIGYGTARKSDLTGAVSTIRSKDFNKGQITSAEQLINGKVSGVQIMSNSGSATAGSTIRVRGGASLNASNDPLIVLDGVPLEQGGCITQRLQRPTHRARRCASGARWYQR